MKTLARYLTSESESLPQAVQTLTISSYSVRRSSAQLTSNQLFLCSFWISLRASRIVTLMFGTCSVLEFSIILAHSLPTVSSLRNGTSAQRQIRFYLRSEVEVDSVEECRIVLEADDYRHCVFFRPSGPQFFAQILQCVNSCLSRKVGLRIYFRLTSQRRFCHSCYH